MIGKYQGTIKSKVAFAGVGLHSGKIVNLEVRPACANTGIIFLRTDTPSCRPIVAHPYNVTSTELCTSIGDGEDRIGTIEHLMAAFYGLGIDNAFVLVDAGELPILDGSAAPFVDKLKEVGTEVQSCLRKVLVIKKPIEVRNGDQFIRIDPWQSLAFECTIDFENSSAIGKQSYKLEFNHSTFLELCEARTFCHIDDVNSMREIGLARGGSLDNAVVVNDSSVINADGLRYKDEFVRHKLLDCMGDLGLLGGKLIGKVTAYKAGHALHAKLTASILQKAHTSVEVIDFGSLDNNDSLYENGMKRENGVDGLGLVANQVSIS